MLGWDDGCKFWDMALRGRMTLFDRYPFCCLYAACFCLKLEIQDLIRMFYDTQFYVVVTRLIVVIIERRSI
jgi:hypothetical protein